MSNCIGYRWLIEHFGLNVVQALRSETTIGPSRQIMSDGWTVRRTVQESLRPESSLPGHLAFALKHEGVHLETLSRLFAVAPVKQIEAWVRSAPTGQYTRRAGFLYEWLTGRQLDLPDTTSGSYIPALDPKRQLTATVRVNNTRWRVRDNLLGGLGFCPQVFLTPETTRALAFNVREHIDRLEEQFSAELLLRSAVWLTIKESRASFAIEHEENRRDRIQRLASVMEQRTGLLVDHLERTELEALQREILGPDALHYGVRGSPIFVGETARLGEELVRYIGPPWEELTSLLAGLRELLRRTVGLSAVARAALVSFGFVYLHPMIDGNGRISRFLINDVLRRDGAVPAPYIVPISAILARPDLRPLSYDGVLEIFSRPLMRAYRDKWSFGPEVQGADGVIFNFHFKCYQDALHAWRYPDLTRHVSFLADALELTIDQEVRSEAQYLQRHRAARASLKGIIDGPDHVLDRIIRSVRESGGRISRKLRKEHSILERPEIADKVVQVIEEAFPPAASSASTHQSPLP